MGFQTEMVKLEEKFHSLLRAPLSLGESGALVTGWGCSIDRQPNAMGRSGVREGGGSAVKGAVGILELQVAKAHRKILVMPFCSQRG